MSDENEHPELAGYQPHESRTLRRGKMLRVMRVVVIIGVVSLILPGIITTMTFSAAAAQRSCEIWVANQVPGSPGSEARFEAFGPGGLGWECYTKGAFGGDQHVASLGLIPGPPKLPQQGVVDS